MDHTMYAIESVMCSTIYILYRSLALEIDRGRVLDVVLRLSSRIPIPSLMFLQILRRLFLAVQRKRPISTTENRY